MPSPTVQDPKPSPPARTPTTREFGRSPQVYASLTTFIASIGTFGGAIAFAVLFSLECADASSHVPKLLAFSSSLFLGAVLGCVPINVALHTQQDVPRDPALRAATLDADASQGQGRVRDPTLTFVRTQSAVVAALMVGAFACMFLAVLFVGLGAPALLGLLLLALSVVWSVLGYLNVPRAPAAVYAMQALLLGLVVLVSVLFGAESVLGIHWENRCRSRLVAS